MSDIEEFNECNEAFMNSIGHAMSLLVPLVFPNLLEILGKTNTLHCADVNSLDTSKVERFLGIVKKCLGNFYSKHKGPYWEADKLDEMEEPGLVYIWYEHEGAISCFLSVMMVLEPLGKTLYLYEIHVLPEFQGHQLGTKLMTHFHDFGALLNSKSQESSSLRRHFASVATGLTVFSDNKRAFKWYVKFGYKFAVDSPLDKPLRNGKILKPTVYVLSRPLNDTAPVSI
ncbi:hypothetical protein METBIDRAFT_37346 [Metschnikowia bicuspidata var. bicuspidata NRRL YB-4993]|uniref:N-alpha-acetyltransferase 40 n=1 Tax=Metschnikowia bicuspidata var. bicuspidata NRRL YB-4993 TaxID=869754 RepID=A0A1A0HIR4_9ASCO|nr:hypothetical protein METBIDRAFT_37346 [Metschnikowia bicuspidata var. bicuspidata NRRL YB-4993]OBA23777.1 hypothetical protein METBIDRAFT_37346 [Metschnikowia bicuspidata var. bicuspidata NRRL YB-4993]